ncbi:MAG: response regulator [Deltaproteobacteria bacterium]|nr:response regulator [Deltaproteobacteria bacterium]
MNTSEIKQQKQKILIVDDELFNLKVVSLALTDLGVDIVKAVSGNEAIEILKKDPIDLVLLDLMMPEMNGFEVLETIKPTGILEHTSVIILTAIQESSEKVHALDLGAVDYITKPFVRAELLARVKLHLSLRRYQNTLNEYATNLEKLVSDRTVELIETQDIISFSLARLAESRDPETGDHLERMSRYSSILAAKLIGNPDLDVSIDKEFARNIQKVAVLHDIGKVGIPDHILLKPGKLTKEEFDIMKTHTTLGGDTLADALLALRKPVDYLVIARDIAYFHHEKWNGQGYPKGLSGTEIPLAARLVALADVYDALRSKRVYKPAFSHEKAKDIILSERGSHFQPLVVDAFLESEKEFIDISERYSPVD